MDQRIKSKPGTGTIVYGDVQAADESLQGTIERMWVKDAIRNAKPVKLTEEKIDEIYEKSQAEIKDLTEPCSPSDPEPTLD